MAIDPTNSRSFDPSQVHEGYRPRRTKEASLGNRTASILEGKDDKRYIRAFFVSQEGSESREPPVYREPSAQPEPRLEPDPAPLPKVVDEPVSHSPNKAPVAAEVKAPSMLWSPSNPTYLRCINGLPLNPSKDTLWSPVSDQRPLINPKPEGPNADKVKPPVQRDEVGKKEMTVFSATAELKPVVAYKDLLFASTVILQQIQMGVAPKLGPHKELVDTGMQQAITFVSDFVPAKSVAELNTVIILVMKYDQDVQGLIRDWDIKTNHPKPFSIGTDDSMGKGTSIQGALEELRVCAENLTSHLKLLFEKTGYDQLFSALLKQHPEFRAHVTTLIQQTLLRFKKAKTELSAQQAIGAIQALDCYPIPS